MNGIWLDDLMTKTPKLSNIKILVPMKIWEPLLHTYELFTQNPKKLSYHVFFTNHSMDIRVYLVLIFLFYTVL